MSMTLMLVSRTRITCRMRVFTGDLGIGVGRELEEVV